ncbi:uncharacterized protein LOC113334667 [Papaver somniferum]|uniref:uncharacterized protein LOC113334667 n=1 Tax=Papaver somniferum TaxID=3469 RepID=UPI000E6FCDD0|nr:uncharacterized protein LOC113334667 [Papaver somniferum]
MGSRDQEEFERERHFNNRGGNNKIQILDNQPEGYGGKKQYYNQGKGSNKVVWEHIKIPHPNTTIEKIWEAITLMEEIPAPPNMGNEPPPGRRSGELCAYHRFHGQTTNNCRNVKKIILRMIDHGKLNHFLVQQPQNLPPPPPPTPPEGHTPGAEKGRNKYLVEVGAKANNPYCNSIIHSFKSIEDFHDNVLSRVFARDGDGRELLNLAKISPLKECEKQPISFTAEEVPGGGEPHDNPLVVKLEINPKEKDDEEEEEEENADIWAINRILIGPGSSVDILFYHTYKTMGGRDEELIPSTYKIYSFNGTTNKPKGEITMRIPLKSISAEIVLYVVDVESPYNALIGRPWLNGILGVASTFHQCIKFPLPQGIEIIRGDIIEGKTFHEIDVDKCEERANKRRN